MPFVAPPEQGGFVRLAWTNPLPAWPHPLAFPGASAPGILGASSAPGWTTVLVHSSDRYPLGNCVSFFGRNNLRSLTRFAVVSSQFFRTGTAAAEPLCRRTGQVRPCPEGLVKYACYSSFLADRFSQEPESQLVPDCSPVARDYPIHLAMDVLSKNFHKDALKRRKRQAEFFLSP